MASSELKMKPRLALSTLKNPCVYHSFDVINKNMFFYFFELHLSGKREDSPTHFKLIPEVPNFHP